MVAAHPDDVDFGAAATVASWTKAGVQVAYCICTSGDAGGYEALPRDRVRALRESEQRAAAAAVGVSDVTFLGHPDGRLSASIELRRDISRQIRLFRPDRVLTQSPEMLWQRIVASHPDHRAVGEATVAAVYPDARNPFAHPELLADEGLAAWSVPELWLMAAPPERINHVVDVTDTFDTKLAALRAHESQTAHMDGLENMLRDWMGNVARNAGLPTNRLAEAFQVVDTA